MLNITFWSQQTTSSQSKKTDTEIYIFFKTVKYITPLFRRYLRVNFTFKILSQNILHCLFRTYIAQERTEIYGV